MPGSHEVVVIVADRRLDIVEVYDAVVCRAGIVVIVFSQCADESCVRDVVFEVGQGLDFDGCLVLDRNRAGVAGRELFVVGVALTVKVEPDFVTAIVPALNSTFVIFPLPSLTMQKVLAGWNVEMDLLVAYL